MDQQKITQTYGINWTKLQQILQAVSPVLQQVILILLQSGADMPAIVTVSHPGIAQADFSAVPGLASSLNIDPNDLIALIQAVGPILGRILINLLQKREQVV